MSDVDDDFMCEDEEDYGLVSVAEKILCFHNFYSKVMFGETFFIYDCIILESLLDGLDVIITIF